MGNKAAREKWITDEFKARIQEKMKKRHTKKRDYLCKVDGKYKEFLTLDDLRNFKQPRGNEIEPLDPSHLGTLFVLDKSKDGRFFIEELIEFIHMYFDRQASKTYAGNVVKEFQGYCTLQLWNYVNRKSGLRNFAKWIGLLLYRGNEVKIHEFPHKKFVARQAIHRLHEIFQVTKSFGVDQPSSFTTLLEVAQQKKMVDVSSGGDQLKDVLPLEILEYFGKEFIEGFKSYMTELGFEPDMDIQ